MAGRGSPPAGETDFRIRLFLPLTVTLAAIEVLVVASSAAAGAVVPVRRAPAMSDT